MKRLKKLAKLNSSDIQQGDYVDFGPYGKSYVCNPNFSDDYFWITKTRSERKNHSAMGWSMPKYQAEKIIETYEDCYDEDEGKYIEEDYYNDNGKEN